MYPEHGTAGEPGAVAGVSGRWRVEGGVGRSAVAVSVARASRVHRHTRGACMSSVWHPRAGLDIICTTWYLVVFKEGSFWCAKQDSRSVHFCDQAEVQTESSPTSRPTLSSWRMSATVSTGLHARRPAGLTTVAKRNESFTRTELVARWSLEGRATYEAVRDALLSVIFLAGARCSNEAGTDNEKRKKNRLHFHCFWGCCAAQCFLFRTYHVPGIKIRK